MKSNDSAIINFENRYKQASLLESKGLLKKSAFLFEELLTEKKLKDNRLLGGIYFHLGRIAYLNGRTGKVRQYLQNCQNLIPGHNKAELYLHQLDNKVQLKLVEYYKYLDELNTAICDYGETSHAAWEDGISHEIENWEQIIRGEFINDTQKKDWAIDLFDPEFSIQEYILRYIPESERLRMRILDVGSGPVTILGKVYNNNKVDLTATDALANEYNELLRKHNRNPPVWSMACEAEKLVDLFQADSFDLVFSRNALDHCYNPLEAIKQILIVLKPGQYALIENVVNEGKRQDYSGLHQWNFDIVDDEFIIKNRFDAISVSINSIFSQVAEIKIEGHQSKDWFRVWIKKSDIPAIDTWI